MSIDFCTIFPDFSDVHVNKDVGMIPRAFHKLGYTSLVVCDKKVDVGDIKTKAINKQNKYSYYFKLALFLIINRPKVVNIYHAKKETFVIGLICSLLRLKVYLKLDLDMNNKSHFYKSVENNFISNWVYSRFSVISTEHLAFYKELLQYENKRISSRVMHIPNAILDFPKRHNSYNKENRILVVGRLGAKQKNVELILDWINKYGVNKNWTLEFIGSYTDEFLDKYKNMHNTGNVKLVGSLDRSAIFDKYSKSKVLLSTSLWEGYSLAMVEAAIHNVYIVTTNVSGADAITENFKYGQLIDFNIDDIEVKIKHLMEKFSNDDIISNKVFRDDLKLESYVNKLCGVLFES